MIPECFLFHIEKFKSKLMLGHLVSLRRLFLKQTSAAYNVPRYISPSVHRGLETVHLVLAILIFELDFCNSATQ